MIDFPNDQVWWHGVLQALSYAVMAVAAIGTALIAKHKPKGNPDLTASDMAADARAVLEAHSSNEYAREMFKFLSGEIEQLRKDLEGERRERQCEVASVKRTARAIVGWARHLVDHWDEVRASPTPPALPADFETLED